MSAAGDAVMGGAFYAHHRITTAPRRWREVAAALAGQTPVLARAGGALYGAWRSQIGRPRDEVTAITAWPSAEAADHAQALLTEGVADVAGVSSDVMAPTLRPNVPTPPTRQGNYAFRWFVTPEADWAEFLDLCAQAWPGFEAAYDSQVIGLWRCGDTTALRQDTGDAPGIRSLLLTRRPNLAMWERSKLPQNAAEATVRDTLSRRYDLCSWTNVYTTTLLTAADAPDEARWA